MLASMTLASIHSLTIASMALYSPTLMFLKKLYKLSMTFKV